VQNPVKNTELFLVAMYRFLGTVLRIS